MNIHIDKETQKIINIFIKRQVKLQIHGNNKIQNQIYKKAGNSFELKNIREYQITDDFRKIDWKLYGRTERFYIKEYFEHENLPIYFFIDISASMKLFDLNYYLNFIFSLSYIFLKLDFTLNIVFFNNRIRSFLTQLKGVKNISKIISVFSKTSFTGDSNFMYSLKQLNTKFNPKIIFIFSDFLFENNYFTTFKNFKKIFLLHFYNRFKNFNFDYDTLLVNDEEFMKTLIFPLNNLTENKIIEKENNYLNDLLFLSKQNYANYFLIEPHKQRYNIYFNVMEQFYA